MSKQPASSIELFDIVFRGDILPKQQLSQVKQRMAQLFKVDLNKVNSLFTGGAVVLKRNLDRATAEKYVTVLNKAGADVQIRKVEPKPTQKTGGAKQAASVTAPANKPKTLQERLGSQETAAPNTKEHTHKVSATLPSGTGDTAISLADAGSDVLRPDERAPVVTSHVDVSQLSIRPAEGTLLDADEYRNVPDMDVDLSALELGELGSDLLRDTEKKTVPNRHFDLSGIDLSAPGSDLGAMKKQDPPQPPDTSHLHIDD